MLELERCGGGGAAHDTATDARAAAVREDVSRQRSSHADVVVAWCVRVWRTTLIVEGVL